MPIRFLVAIFCVSLLTSHVTNAAQDEKERGPEDWPKSAMAQFYSVPLSAVASRIIERTQTEAVVETEHDYRICRFKMTHVPTAAPEIQNRWMMSDMLCNKLRVVD